MDSIKYRIAVIDVVGVRELTVSGTGQKLSLFVKAPVKKQDIHVLYRCPNYQLLHMLIHNNFLMILHVCMKCVAP